MPATVREACSGFAALDVPNKETSNVDVVGSTGNTTAIVSSTISNSTTSSTSPCIATHSIDSEKDQPQSTNGRTARVTPDIGQRTLTGPQESTGSRTRDLVVFKMNSAKCRSEKAGELVSGSKGGSLPRIATDFISDTGADRSILHDVDLASLTDHQPVRLQITGFGGKPFFVKGTFGTHPLVGGCFVPTRSDSTGQSLLRPQSLLTAEGSPITMVFLHRVGDRETEPKMVKYSICHTLEIESPILDT